MIPLAKNQSLPYSEAELLHEELHHPLGTRHIVFGLHVDVSEKSFQDQKIASICPLCAKLHHPNPKNKKVTKIYSQLSIKSNPLWSTRQVLGRVVREPAPFCRRPVPNLRDRRELQRRPGGCAGAGQLR